MKYAILNGNGTPNAFYDSNIHKSIPKEAIEITNDQWIECISHNGKRKFVNGILVEYVYVPTLNEVKTERLSTIKADYENALKAMIGDTDPAEMASWTKQETEARAWTVDNNAITPIIDNLIIGRAMGESKADLVAKIIAKADGYAVAYSQVLGQYHAKQKALEACTTVEAVIAL